MRCPHSRGPLPLPPPAVLVAVTWLVACGPVAPTPPSDDGPEERPRVPSEGVGGARAPVTPPTGSGATFADENPENPWLRGFGGAGSASAGGSPGSGAGSGGTIGGGTGGSEPAPPEVPPQLLITQYFEGLGADKALELTNVGTAPAHLASCTLAVHTNGGQNPYRTSTLSGVLPPGGSLVYCSSAFTSAHPALCAATLSSFIFNGNDAIVLRCGGEVLDRFGRVGEDPGSAWGDKNFTMNANLLRSCSANAGDIHLDAPFVPEDAWVRVPLTELAGLGGHECPDLGAGGAGSAAD